MQCQEFHLPILPNVKHSICEAISTFRVSLYWHAGKALRREIECKSCNALQGGKQDAEAASKHHTADSDVMSSAFEQSNSRSSSTVTAAVESHKGPRRRNRVERAALQREQDLADKQESRRRLR